MDPATGGPCQGIRNSVPDLKRIGLRNEIVCLDDPSSVFLNEDLCEIHALGVGKGPWKYNSKLVPWLLKNLHRFDVVIMHGLWLYPSYAITKAMKIFKKEASKNKTKALHIPKLFIMPHGMLDPYFQKDPGRKLKALRNCVYWKLVERNVINNADGLLFTCQEELQLAREPFSPYRPKREINVGYGIKTPPVFSAKMAQAFLKVCPNIKSNAYFLFLSRIHDKKGVDLLVEAYSSQLKKEIKKGNIFPKLVIAGPGIESSYGKKILKFINETPDLKEHIKFPGLLLGDAKWGAYYGCEAFILPSHQENFGIVVAEALACGKPVLISDKVNIWREIKKDAAGIITTDTLIGVEKLFQNWQLLPNEEKLSMGSNAVRLFKKNFTSEAAAKRLKQVFITNE
ncbi:MAG: glycosyltransferase [Ginsengibacter sp.]